jgi:hypothetical protein
MGEWVNEVAPAALKPSKDLLLRHLGDVVV